MDKGKRVDKISILLYEKEYKDLVSSYTKIQVLSLALDDAENEIEELETQLRIEKSNSLP